MPLQCYGHLPLDLLGLASAISQKRQQGQKPVHAFKTCVKSLFCARSMMQPGSPRPEHVGLLAGSMGCLCDNN